MDEKYNLNNILSTGNGFVDALMGGLSGGANALNPRGKYYVTANYKGNGLANTGIDYMANPDYKSFANGAQMLSSLFKRNNSDTSSNSILNKLSALVNKNQGSAPYTLQGELKNHPYEGYGNYNLPYKKYELPQTSFDYNGVVVPKQYKLPTQSFGTLDFNRWK